MAAIVHPPLAAPCEGPGGLRLVRPAPGPPYALRRLAAALVLVLAVLAGASVVRAGAVAVAALAGGTAAVAVLPPATAVPAPQPVHVVRPGDTYWSVAVSLGRPGDVRAVVDRLVAVNGSRRLQPGDRLTLPVP